MAACMVASMHCVSAKGGLDHPTDATFFFVTRLLCAVGGAGVDIFFVVSGFIIMTIADRPVDGRRLDVAMKFLTRRFLRIYPLYWITLVLMLAMLGSAGLGGPALHQLGKWQVWLLTRTQIGLQPPAWSLVFEVWFYACTAALLLLPQRQFRMGVAVWACLQVVVLCWHLWGGGWPRTPIVAKPQVLEFFLGCGVSCVARRYAVGPRVAAVCLAVAAVVFAAGSLRCYVALPKGSLFDTERLLFYGGPATLLVLALVSWEWRNHVCVPVWLRRVGDSSYSIYLWHFPLMSGAVLAVPLGSPGLWPSLPRAMLEFGVTLLVARWSYRLIERPTIRLGHHLTSRGTAHEAAA